MDDRELHELLLKDKDKGFEKLAMEYQSKVYYLAVSYFHSRSEAEDITQDVLVKIYQKLPGFQWFSKLSTWIYRITVNTCHDYARRKKMIREDSDTLLEEKAAPERDGMESDTVEKIRLAVGRLPEKYRGTVVLRYIEKLSCGEIAEIFHCSLSSVEVKLYRARKILREFLEPYLAGEVSHEMQ